jgi:hypothetical protein
MILISGWVCEERELWVVLAPYPICLILIIVMDDTTNQFSFAEMVDMHLVLGRQMKMFLGLCTNTEKYFQLEGYMTEEYF